MALYEPVPVHDETGAIVGVRLTIMRFVLVGQARKASWRHRADRFNVRGIVLVDPDIRLHKLRGNQLHVKTLGLQLPTPMVRSGTRLHADLAARLDCRQQDLEPRRPCQPLSPNWSLMPIDAQRPEAFARPTWRRPSWFWGATGTARGFRFRESPVRARQHAPERCALR